MQEGDRLKQLCDLPAKEVVQHLSQEIFKRWYNCPLLPLPEGPRLPQGRRGRDVEEAKIAEKGEDVATSKMAKA